MQIKQNQNLKSYNTFGIDVNAKGFIQIHSENDLYEVLVEELSPLKIMGGGSNILLTEDIDAYVLRNEIKGIDIVDEDDDRVMVNVGAGEKWHNFVLWAISHGLGGVENLSLIPGSVGAAPMQNIGAYGVEQESVFHSLSAIHLETGVRKSFFKYECKFGYRESVFKNELKDQYFITHVCYILKKNKHILNIDYGVIKDVLNKKNIEKPTILDVSEAVIEIRQSKLPDPRKVGNAGSFFKNPVISSSQFDNLVASYPDVPSFPQEDGTVKIPAGWLIERLGYKGKKYDTYGVHKDQALVLVNYGGSKGRDIYNLSLEIKGAVFKKFYIDIQHEVNVW